MGQSGFFGVWCDELSFLYLTQGVLFTAYRSDERDHVFMKTGK